MTDTLKDIIDALSLYSNEYLIPDYLAETPDYRSNLVRRSCRRVEGERISIMRSGAPLQPISSSFLGSQMTEMSGSTIVSTSYGESPSFSNRRTAKGRA